MLRRTISGMTLDDCTIADMVFAVSVFLFAGVWVIATGERKEK
jgi:hypothetical protein